MAAVGAALLMGGVSVGHAQEQLDLSILNEGKPPAEPVTVSAMQGGEKVELATTNSAGTAAIDFGLLNLGKSTPVDIIVINCNGETEVILLPPGEVSEECEKAGEDPNCDCARIGTIYWGDTRTATIRIEQGGVTLETGDGSSPQPTAGGPGVRIGAGATWSTFPQLEDTGCSQTGITGCEVDDSSIGPFVTVEWMPSGSVPFGIGLRGDYKKVSIAGTFEGNGLPSANLTEVDIWSLGAYLFFGWRLTDRFLLIPEAGLLNAWNSGTVTSTYFGGDLTESRSQSGIRATLGVSAQIGLSSQWDLRGGYRFTNGDSDDADQNHEFNLGVGFNTGGGR
jgi:opacity protein-like surface antigen